MPWGALALLLACGDPEPPAGTVLFVSEAGDVPATVSVGTDGAGARTVRGVPGAVFPAAPDPRGTHALVVSSEDDSQGHRERLWLVPRDGGAPLALTPHAGRIRNPAWSPDGAWIAFESDAASYRDLYRVSREGVGLTRLTEAPNGSFEPAVSPDGRRLLFGSSRDGNAEIYMADADGGDVRRLTDHPSDDVQPAWSPDGQRVAWLSWRDGPPRVWILDLATGSSRALRPPAGVATDLDLAWSPDGGRIAITVQTGPTDVGIAIHDAIDGRRLAVLDAPGADENPAWSPDGGWLAFTSSRNGDPDVYLATADGRVVRRLTGSPAAEWLPRWGA